MKQKQRVNIQDLKRAVELSKRTEASTDEILEIATHLGVVTLEEVFQDQEELDQFKEVIRKRKAYMLARRN